MFRWLRYPFCLFGVGVLVTTGLAMILVPGLIEKILSPGAFMPHIHCYLDDPRMVRLQGWSDFIIGSSYMLISGALAYLVLRMRREIPFQWMFLAFGIFIFSCGWTHFLEVWTLWHPTYWLSGGVKAVTAAASLATGIGFVYLMPHIFSLLQAAKASESRRQELVRTNEELRFAYRDLETFSYTLSHDIRAPLRAVNTFTQLVLEQSRDKLPGESVEMLQKALLAAMRIDRLANEVLALSRLSRSEMRSQQVELQTLLDQIIRTRPDLQPNKADVQIQHPLIPVRGDPTLLSQCLENLLGNAVKFVSPGIKPRVVVRTQTHGDKVLLWVEDNGIGISGEDREKIFEPFKRLQGSNYEGTGIGLAIVRKAVERMGGELGFDSEPSKGSRFWISLNRAEG